MPTRRIVVVAAIVNALLLGAVGWLVVRDDAEVATRQAAGSAWHGTMIDPPMPERPFTLESAAGPVMLSGLRGNVVLLFFGYASCPDVCPLTLAKLAQVRRALQPDDAAAVRVVLVSVDPEHDSPERLARYVSQFDDSFIGLTGTRAQIEALARAYGIFHDAGNDAASVPDTAPGASDVTGAAAQMRSTAQMDHTDSAAHHHADTQTDTAAHGAPAASAVPLIAHTTHILVLDRAGQLALLWSTSVSADAMRQDLRRLLRP
ncbi:MAG: SCO family protein [Longimicrobiales bacterium]